MQKKAILLLVSTVTFAIVKSMGNPNESVGEEDLYKCWNGCMCLLDKKVRGEIIKCIRKHLTSEDLVKEFQRLKDYGYKNIFDFENDDEAFAKDYCVVKEEKERAGWKEDIFDKSMQGYIHDVKAYCEDPNSPECKKFNEVAKCIKKEFDKQKAMNDCGHRKN